MYTEIKVGKLATQKMASEICSRWDGIQKKYVQKNPSTCKFRGISLVFTSVGLKCINKG